MNKMRLNIIHANVASWEKKEEGTGVRPWEFTVYLYYLLIGVDNYVSTFMTNNICHFIRPLKSINNRVVKVYLGVIKVRIEVGIKRKTEDDECQIHSIIIHNVNYTLEAPIFLFLPHILYWNQERYKRTIPWYTGTNTVHIRSMPSTNTYCILVA